MMERDHEHIFSISSPEHIARPIIESRRALTRGKIGLHVPREGVVKTKRDQHTVRGRFIESLRDAISHEAVVCLPDRQKLLPPIYFGTQSDHSQLGLAGFASVIGLPGRMENLQIFPVRPRCGA
jgi:hypothetical protein